MYNPRVTRALDALPLIQTEALKILQYVIKLKLPFITSLQNSEDGELTFK